MEHFIIFKYNKMLTCSENDTTSNADNTEEPLHTGDCLNTDTMSSETTYCSVCKFTTTNKKLFQKHLLTEKHKYSMSVIDAYNKYATLLSSSSPDIVIEIPKDSIIRTSHRCYCGKIYKHRQSLCIHKKKCTYVHPDHNLSDSEPESDVEPELAPAPRPAPAPRCVSATASDVRPALEHTHSLITDRPPKLITPPADIILINPFTPEQVRRAIYSFDAYETSVNEPTENTYPDNVDIPKCATDAILVTAESLSNNVSADSSISAIANVIASSYSEETRELCIHREVVVRCIKLVLPLYLNFLTRMNMQEDEDLPEDMIEIIDPDAPITIGYLALKSCVNILYFILSRIDEQPINEGDDIVNISNYR
jgi:hypothetical protein